MKILIKEHKNHIKGYGFISDLDDKTRYGVDIDLISLLEKQGAIFSVRFVEDPSLPKYEFRHPDCPPCDIPYGTLTVYAEFPNENPQIRV